MPKLYRKCPVDVEVVEFTGDNWKEIEEFIPPSNRMKHQGTLLVLTCEGYLKASVGDMIIKGVKGEFYPCKPSVFAKSYVEVTFPEKAS